MTTLFQKGENMATVSYTHLDVYKRQVGTIHFNQIGKLLLAAPESSAELFTSQAE